MSCLLRQTHRLFQLYSIDAANRSGQGQGLHSRKPFASLIFLKVKIPFNISQVMHIYRNTKQASTFHRITGVGRNHNHQIQPFFAKASSLQ